MFLLIEKYAHRENQDGTYDSICPTCARTVARGLSEARLTEAERFHKCLGLSPSVVERVAREIQ
jgi:hypothetical protein